MGPHLLCLFTSRVFGDYFELFSCTVFTVCPSISFHLTVAAMCSDACSFVHSSFCLHYVTARPLSLPFKSVLSFSLDPVGNAVRSCNFANVRV